MALVGEWIRRLGHLLRRRALEEELREEMDAHRARLAEPRAFGHALRLREEASDAWGWRWLDELSQDVRYGARRVRTDRGTTYAVVIVLALGIGANTVFFTFVNALCLEGLPIEEVERVLFIGSRDAQGTWDRLSETDYDGSVLTLRSFDGAVGGTGQRPRQRGRADARRIALHSHGGGSGGDRDRAGGVPRADAEIHPNATRRDVARRRVAVGATVLDVDLAGEMCRTASRK